MTTGLIPCPWPVCHIARDEDLTTKDSHGNHPIIDSPPVIRYVQLMGQIGRRGSSHEVFTPEFAERVETTFDLAVPDPETYKNGDQVLINPGLDATGNYVPGSGTAFFVDGDPASAKTGPWPQYYGYFGGVVRMKRVT